MGKIISVSHFISSKGPFCAVCSTVLVFFQFTYSNTLTDANMHSHSSLIFNLLSVGTFRVSDSI